MNSVSPFERLMLRYEELIEDETVASILKDYGMIQVPHDFTSLSHRVDSIIEQLDRDHPLYLTAQLISADAKVF